MLDSIPRNWWFGICDKVASSSGPSPWEGPEDKAMIKEADSEILKSSCIPDSGINKGPCSVVLHD